MKAFEAQNSTNKARYEKIMGEINKSINKGNVKHILSSYSSSTNYFNDEIQEMLLDDGFDLKLNYNIYDQLESVTISWENAKEGKRGELTINKKENTPQPKRRFFGWFSSSGSRPEDDGVCMDF